MRPRLVSLGLLAALVFAWRAQWAFQFAIPRASGGWRLLGGVAVLCALWLLGERERQQVGEPVGFLDRRREVLLAGALCLLGVAFRTVHFSSVPGGMNHDAAFNGMFALHVLGGAPYTPYISAAWGRETLFMYLCTPLVAWLGNVPEAIQIAATLVGVATLPLFYLFARALCGARVALVGLAFFAVSGWHGVFSRVGWRMIMVPPFELLALFGLWRALQSGARRYWVLTGIGAALAIYTYDAGRLVPLMVALLFAVFLLIDRDRRRLRLLGGFVVLAVFVLAAAPMLWYAANHFEQFSARTAHLAAGEQPAGGMLARLATTAAMFNYRGNGNDFFINEPLLEPLAAVLFVFGLLVVPSRLFGVRGWGLRGSDQPRTPNRQPPERKPLIFILVALAVALLPGLLSVPNGNRCIAALPLVYVIIAIGALALVDAVARALPAGAVRRRAALLLLGGLIAAAGIETYREFLGAGRRRIFGFGPEATAAGEYLRGFGDAYARYVVAEDWPEYTLAYLSYNGGGTPLENHYVIGRRLEDIEARINRFGRKGLVFLTDMKPAGRRALERLRPMFAEHRIDAVAAPRLGGAQVATALIVEPQRAAAPARGPTPAAPWRWAARRPAPPCAVLRRSATPGRFHSPPAHAPAARRRVRGGRGAVSARLSAVGRCGAPVGRFRRGRPRGPRRPRRDGDRAAALEAGAGTSSTSPCRRTAPSTPASTARRWPRRRRWPPPDRIRSASPASSSSRRRAGSSSSTI
jgi:4-amino-4-deoxy-L-arabinose transferase-like glycosyltransferase